MHVNEFQDDPATCAERAADPAWREEQVRKNQTATERFARRREEIGLPLVQSDKMRVAG